MNRFLARLGVIPSLLFGISLLGLGLLSINYIVDNWWPFDVERLDLIRDTAVGTIDAPTLLAAANNEIIFAFLGAVLITITGLVLPLVFFLNRRFGNRESTPGFLLTLRQAMFVGIWVAFCIWLQMNRSLGLAVMVLVAVVLILFEFLLQVRTRAAGLSG
ncbi:MAG: hypothetical protein AAF614_27970 [Chloroflexota bacterium]